MVAAASVVVLAAVTLAVYFAAAVVHLFVVVALFSLCQVSAVFGFLLLLLGFFMVQARLVTGSLTLAQLTISFALVDALLLSVVAAVNFINARVVGNVGGFNAARSCLTDAWRSGSARARCALRECRGR